MRANCTPFGGLRYEAETRWRKTPCKVLEIANCNWNCRQSPGDSVCNYAEEMAAIRDLSRIPRCCAGNSWTGLVACGFVSSRLLVRLADSEAKSLTDAAQ